MLRMEGGDEWVNIKGVSVRVVDCLLIRWVKEKKENESCLICPFMLCEFDFFFLSCFLLLVCGDR